MFIKLENKVFYEDQYVFIVRSETGDRYFNITGDSPALSAFNAEEMNLVIDSDNNYHWSIVTDDLIARNGFVLTREDWVKLAGELI